MNSLHEFLRAMGPTPARDRFVLKVRKLMGAASRVSLQYLRHIAAGRKTASAELCIALEKASAGFLRCEATRPDIDWMYLAKRSSKGAVHGPTARR